MKDLLKTAATDVLSLPSLGRELKAAVYVFLETVTNCHEDNQRLIADILLGAMKVS